MKKYVRKYLLIWTLCLTSLLFFGLSGGILAATAGDDPETGNTGTETSVVYTSQDLLGVSSITSSLTYLSPYTNKTYTVPSTVKANGIDVSKWQGTIDWNAVASEGDVDFAYIRAGNRGSTAGNLNTDPNFVTNIEGAQAAGLKVGVSIFSQATTIAEAVEEAQYVLNLVSNYYLDLPIVMDYEYDNNAGRLYDAGLTKSQATSICQAFCDTISSAGYVPMVYANYDFWTNHLNASELASGTAIWYARFNSSPSYTGAYAIWQYSNSGSVSGISGNVDSNFSFVNLDKLGIPFTDVAEGTWYLGSVHYAYQHHLLQGTTNATFSPDTAMSRAMLVTVLYREEGSPPVSGSSTFTDLKQTWYQNAVLWAQQNNIVSGISATIFDPDTSITREQMAAILYRYSKQKGYDLTASGNLANYSDGGNVSDFATAAMQWAIGKGYISGFDNGTLQAKATANRAQVATILMRFCEDHDS